MSVSMTELEHWDIDDFADGHDILDALEDAERKANRPT